MIENSETNAKIYIYLILTPQNVEIKSTSWNLFIHPVCRNVCLRYPTNKQISQLALTNFL